MFYEDSSVVKNGCIFRCLVKLNNSKYLFMKQVFFLGVFRGYMGLSERLGTEKRKLKTETGNKNSHEKQFQSI